MPLCLIKTKASMLLNSSIWWLLKSCYARILKSKKALPVSNLRLRLLLKSLQDFNKQYAQLVFLSAHRKLKAAIIFCLLKSRRRKENKLRKLLFSNRRFESACKDFKSIDNGLLKSCKDFKSIESACFF